MKKPIVVCERRGRRSLHQIMLLRNGFWNSRFCMFENAQFQWAYFFCSINSAFCKERRLQFFLNRNLGHIFSCFLWYNSRFVTVLKTLNSHVPFIPVLQKQRQGDELEASWSTQQVPCLFGHTLWPCQMNKFKKIKQKSKVDMLDFHNLTQSMCKQMQYIDRVR